jgi:hypothetical protein
MSTSNQRPPHSESQSRGSVAFARFFWIFFGPMVLALIAYSIVQSGTGWMTWLDAAFLATTALILFARWYELSSGEGQDGYGNPATLADFPRYARLALPIAIGVWVAANLLGNHLLDGG